MLDVAPTPTLDATRPDPALVELERPPSPLHASSPKRRAPSPSLKAQTLSGDAGTDALRPIEREHATAAGPANCRLLWRGKVVTQDGQNLHGIAIIAHLFSVASASSGLVPRFSPALAAAAAAASSSLSPFDDPFSSASSAGASGADMCLGLEMLRGAPITAKGDVRIVTDSTVQLPGSSGAGSRDRKGKGKASEAQEVAAESIQVETPTDVRVYIDDRCPETVDWFQDKFCREGRQGYGVRFTAGGEEVVIFAKLPEEAADPTPSTSDATASATLPGLTLLLGRPVQSRANQPRPDDPMPRENLFAKKLRKTASLPASAFPTSTSSAGRGPLEPAPPPATKRRRQSAKDKAIASLLGGSGLVGDKSKKRRTTEAAMPPPASRSKQPSSLCSSLPNSKLFGAASLTTNRSFGRTSSTSRFSSVEPAHTGKGLLSRQTSLPPNVGLPLRRASSVSATTALPTHSSRSSSFKRSLSRSSLLLESPPGSEDEAEEEEDGELVDRAFMRQFRAGSASARSRMGSRAPPSPTPSVMSLAEPDDQAMDVDGDGDDAESLDAVAELRAFAPSSNDVDTAENWGASSSNDSLVNVGGDRAGRGRKQMARSSSLPVGQFALASVDTAKGRRTRAGSTSSSVDGVVPAVADVGESGMAPKTSGLSSAASAVETRNKNTVKKITMHRMDGLGCGKAHSEFKDIFSLTTRGVAFAMRSTFKTTPLSTEERQRATDLIEKHLVMYMPVELFPLVKTLVEKRAGGGGDDEPLERGKPVARQVEAVGREPPSPKSLGDHHVEESESRAVAEQGEGSFVGDVPETHVELEEETQIEEETQLEETQMAGQDGVDVEVASVVDIDQVTTQTLKGPSISVAAPVDSARDDEEDVDEMDEIILVQVPSQIPTLETRIPS